jgi:opacity protein-like surface antigen
MMRSTLAATVLVVVTAAAADAQVTINGGLGWSGGYGIGDATAQLRTNATGTTPPPFTLFNVDSRIDQAPGGELRVGVAITPRVAIEGGALFARRRLAFNISGDPETAPQELDGENLQHYVFDAGVLWELPLVRQRRFRTFASGGAGYVRQLHQDRTLVESGQVYYLGGAARYWLRGGPASNRSLGVRGDVRLNLRRNGIEFDDQSRVYPTVSLAVFLGL